MGLKDRIFSRGDGTPAAPPERDAPVTGSSLDDERTIILPKGALDDAGEHAEPTGEGGETAEQATQVIPVVTVPADAPAEPAAPLAPDPASLVPAQPGWRERGRLRRRLAYLREVRELGYRDLGGLVFDQHRFQRPNDSLVHGKVLAIDAVDRELRAIEQALHARRLVTELALPGLSACQRCGALHGSDARYCPQCGLAFAGPRTIAGIGDVNVPYPIPTARPGQAALFDPSSAPAETAPSAEITPLPAPGPPAGP